MWTVFSENMALPRYYYKLAPAQNSNTIEFTGHDTFNRIEETSRYKNFVNGMELILIVTKLRRRDLNSFY